MGITISGRKYDLTAATPFEASDVLNLQPVVKHCIPVCTEAKDLVEMGKIQLAEVSTSSFVLKRQLIYWNSSNFFFFLYRLLTHIDIKMYVQAKVVSDSILILFPPNSYH